MPLKFKNKKLQARLNKISPEFDAAMRKRFEIAEQLSLLLKAKGLTQRELADVLGKRESEISKWLSGTHNFTIDSIALIEFHLGKSALVICPKDIVHSTHYFYSLSSDSGLYTPILISEHSHKAIKRKNMRKEKALSSYNLSVTCN